MAEIINRIVLSKSDVGFLSGIKIPENYFKISDWANLDNFDIVFPKTLELFIEVNYQKERDEKREHFLVRISEIRHEKAYLEGNYTYPAYKYFFESYMDSCGKPIENSYALPGRVEMLKARKENWEEARQRKFHEALMIEIITVKIQQILYLMLNYNEIFDIVSKRIECHEAKTNSRNKNKKKNRKIIKHYKLFRIINSEDIKRKISAKHKFTCELWSVRGHYRKYKSGKTVYIKPYNKGKNRNKDITITMEHKIIPSEMRCEG